MSGRPATSGRRRRSHARSVSETSGRPGCLISQEISEACSLQPPSRPSRAIRGVADTPTRDVAPNVKRPWLNNTMPRVSAWACSAGCGAPRAQAEARHDVGNDNDRVAETSLTTASPFARFVRVAITSAWLCSTAETGETPLQQCLNGGLRARSARALQPRARASSLRRSAIRAYAARSAVVAEWHESRSADCAHIPSPSFTNSTSTSRPVTSRQVVFGRCVSAAVQDERRVDADEAAVPRSSSALPGVVHARASSINQNG